MATFHIVVVPPRADAFDDKGPESRNGGEAAGRGRRHDVRAGRGREREADREVRRAWGGKGGRGRAEGRCSDEDARPGRIMILLAS